MPTLPLGPRKRRTREHVIADLSVNHVERHALLCGFSVERIRLDYGIDLIVHTYTRTGQIENGRVLFQLKATDRLKVSSDGTLVRCRVERADLGYWLGEPMPVILVLYDARKEIAFWLLVQEHLAGQPALHVGHAGQRVTIGIPRSNVLNRAAMRQFARKKNAMLTQTRN